MTTTTKKLTKRDHFNAILATYPLSDEHRAFIEHELELLDKKNSADKKPTAQQVANESVKADILAKMVPNQLYTATEVQKMCGIESNQRATALLTQLKNAGLVTKTEDKRKSYFSIAE